MPAQLGNPGRKTSLNLDRPGVDFAVCAKVRVVLEVRDTAVVAMGVAGRPDEDRLVGPACLCERLDITAEDRAQIIFAVLIDDPVVPDARIDEIECPPVARPVDQVIDPGRPPIVDAGSDGQRERLVRTVSSTRRNGEHRDIGAPGDTLRRPRAGIVEHSAAPGRDDARDRRAVRKLVTGFVPRRPEEVLAYRLAREHRVPDVNSGVDETDCLTAASFPSDAVLQLELRIGNVGPYGR